MKNNNKQRVRIGLVQMSCSSDAKKNIQKAVSRIRSAAAKGAKIVCLQELFRTPYFCQTENAKNFGLAEAIPGPTTQELCRAARQTKTVIVASLFEKTAKGRYHNTAAVIDADGKYLGKYRKMHIPEDPGFYEKFYFVPGDLGFKVFKTRYADIGVLVCWDQWFPEAARLTALAGADILFYPTAIGWKPSEPKETKVYHSAWETVQRGHAIANSVFVAAVNRVGKEGALKFWGSSFVSDPFGEVIYRASSQKEEIILADCDLSKVEKTRGEWPFFRDRRVDFYSPIVSRAVKNRIVDSGKRNIIRLPSTIQYPLSGFRMPAEWEPHSATWLTWPTNRITWPGRHLKVVEGITLKMARGLLAGEKVHLLVPDEVAGRKVLSLLEAKKARTSNLILHKVKTVDTWIRDYGPIFVKSSTRPRNDIAFCKFIFNGWGGKYKDLATDTRVVDRVGYLKHFRRMDIPMVLEGGSIDMDGRGTCLTTEQCLLNPNRNPKLSKAQIGSRIKKNLGVTKIIWLKEGIEGDDTDGHVDDITRFVAPRTVLTAVEPDTSDKNHGYLDENLEILKRSKDAQGKRLKVHELPMPGRVEVKEGHSASGRLPASYANFYIGNAAVLLPVYSHANDKKAERILKKLFPGRKIIPIECTSLVFGLGSIHCVTQQQPV